MGEWYRALAESAIPPDRQMPRDLWRWNVEVDGVADLSTPEKLAGVGLVPPRPSRATWPPFQEVGEKLWSLGYRGVICPSAARPEHRTLCVFRESDEIPGAQPVRPAVTVRWAPAPPPGMTT